MTPEEKKEIARLSPAMREALMLAAVGKGSFPYEQETGGITRATCRALKRRGLVTFIGYRHVLITDYGRRIAFLLQRNGVFQ